MLFSSSTMRTWATGKLVSTNGGGGARFAALAPAAPLPPPEASLGLLAPALPGPLRLERLHRLHRLRRLAVLVEAGQRDDELGSLAGRGPDRDGAAVRPDDPLADREPEPGPLLLGRVEGDEDVLPRLLGDPRARVAEADLDHVPPPLPLAPEGQLVPLDAGRDGEPPAPRHRLVGVEGEVQEDLLQLLRVAQHAREGRREIEPDLDLRRRLGEQEPERLVEDLVHRARRHRRLQGARVVEELRHDAVQAVDLLDDDLEELAVLPLETARLQVLDGALDGGERVADLVRQAGGHLAERGEPVALLHLLVELRVLDDERAAIRHLEERRDLVGGEGLGDALVPAREEA